MHWEASCGTFPERIHGIWDRRHRCGSPLSQSQPFLLKDVLVC